MGLASMMINRKLKFIKTNIVVSAGWIDHATRAAARGFSGSGYDDVGMRAEREIQGEQEVNVLWVQLAA